MEDRLIPRPGPAPRVSEGPKVGQRSLYRQRVLDEDTYTEALSHIITRDFFPDLPQIHATNSYLSALTNNDPELLSSSIRRLAALAREDKGPDEDFSVTPSIRPSRTPIGARDWDTPLRSEAGPSRKRTKLANDLSLDAFQRNFTSEDNASFSQIVDEENRKRKEERWGWAWEAEKKAEQRRLEGEERRKVILDTAINGQWRVNAEGKRLTGALSEGGTEKDAGEVWKEPLRIEDGDLEAPTGALEASTGQSQALIMGDQAAKEHHLPSSHPLSKALVSAGLPATAMVSEGAIVPHTQDSNRGVMNEEHPEYLSGGGSGTDLWRFKTRNNFYFPADANTDPYPKRLAQPKESRQLPPSVIHGNTRLVDKEQEVPRSQRGSSPSSSIVDRAVRGEAMPSINSYPLLPNDPSPSPQDLPSLLTWGSLAATPRVLDSGDDLLDAGPSFRMPETKRRDDIGRRLADKAKQSMNQRAQGFTPRTGLASALRSAADRSQRSVRGESRDMLPPGTPRRESLTPAGKRLLETSLGRKQGTSSVNRSAAMEKAAGWVGKQPRNLSWTPSPRR